MKLLIGAILVIAAVPVCAQAQPPSTAKAAKADAQKVVKMISADKAKIHTYCNMAKLGDQIEEADQNKDAQKTDELNQKRDELTERLGLQFIRLLDELQDIDPESEDGQEIGSMLEAFDQLCAG
jgi:hypothetical protein